MTVPTLQGVMRETITTPRIATRVLLTGPEPGEPVLLLHGNVSSATWWEDVMLTLPPDFRGIAPDQRGYGEADPEKKIDATRGTGDLADDAVALLDHLGIANAHVVGNSMGGSVVWRMLAQCPERFLTVTLVAPGSPFGFGGTRDAHGTPCWEDYAGSGGGLANPELMRLMQADDRGMDSPFSPRAALRTLVFKPPFVPMREESLLTAMLQTHLGPQDLPGDFVKSANWPFVAPGVWGPANAMSSKYAGDVDALYAISPKPRILWIRGSDDLAVADAAASCPGNLGAQGLIPGWPGMAVFPPQPMLAQTRGVLEKYAVAGGGFREEVMADTGHAPFIENLAEFNEIFHPHLG
jgi:pimeloyl-ACP methyl ester carboxylesterase